MANLNELKREGKRAYRRVGRGQGSTRGKQSGRGGKGQTARAGHKIRPAIRDMIKKLPKRRGYGKNRARTVDSTRPATFAVPLARLDTHFESGADITREVLRARGIIGRKDVDVKIVGTGASKKFTIKGIAISAGARASVEKAGGTIA
jgi:large subunit ribosomal protein L15